MSERSLFEKVIFGELEDGNLNINEMATIGSDDDYNFLVIVAPDRGRNDAYFKVYNHKSHDSADKVARVGFKEAKVFIHKGDGKRPWEMNKKEVKRLIRYLKATPKSNRWGNFSTNWELAVFLWNNECRFTGDKEYDEAFPEGCDPESNLFKKPQFVPLNQKMPDYTKLEF